MGGNDTVSCCHELRQTNWSDHEPYFTYDFYKDNFKTKGRWVSVWTVHWDSCGEDTFVPDWPDDMIYNISSLSVPFTIENSAPKMDLVAASANKTCPGELGLAIDISSHTMRVPAELEWDRGETCAVVASTTLTPTPDPCRVKIDSNIAGSLSASWKARLCKGIKLPSDCPKKDENAAEKLMAFGVAWLLTALGAIGFVLI